jgi:hypothetical protein
MLGDPAVRALHLSLLSVSGGMKLDFIRRFEIPFSSDWIFFPLFR